MSERAEHHRRKAAEAIRRQQESERRSDTDGFLSQWALGLEARRHQLQAELEEQGGRWEFPALYDSDGERVHAKLIDARYGPCWALCTPGTDEFTGTFFGVGSRKLKLSGMVEGTEWAPARARIVGRGTGLSGRAWAAVVRIDDGTGADPRVRREKPDTRSEP